MKNLSLTFCLAIATLFGSVGNGFANSVNGSFVCEIVFIDGSSKDIYVKTTERGMKVRRLDSDFEEDYIEIHKGKTNDFRVFVQIKNAIQEDIVVLTATEDSREFHYNETGTGDWNVSITDRIRRGICKKL